MKKSLLTKLISLVALTGIVSVSLIGCTNNPLTKPADKETIETSDTLNTDNPANVETVTTAPPSFTEDTILAKIDGKDIKFKDMTQTLLPMSDFLVDLYYEDYVMVKLAESKNIKTKNRPINEIRTELMGGYSVVPSEGEIQAYIESNITNYADANLLVVKGNSVEELKALGVTANNIAELAKTKSTSELLKQTAGFTGMNPINFYTNSLPQETKTGYITPEPIPFEDTFAYVKVQEMKLRDTAVQDATVDLMSNNTSVKYQEDIAKLKETTTYEKQTVK